MRTLLRAALGCSIMAGAIFTAAPAYAETVCVTLSNGAVDCYDNGGTVPGTGFVGGSSSNDVAQPPSAPRAPYVPARPAPAAPAPRNVPAAPAPVQNQVPQQHGPAVADRPGGSSADTVIVPFKGTTPVNSPALARVPSAEAPATAVTPSVAAPSPSASMTSTQMTSSPTATPSAEQLQSEQASRNGDSPAAFFGVLAILILGATGSWWQRKAIKARHAEYRAYEASKS
ncbi:MAG: hypothetical protein JWO49_1156 [Arthrobacter sp.]|nr:hypothetical protein [Arthrobacter sp.]